METKVVLMCIDEDRRDDDKIMRNVRLLDAATLMDLGSSGYGSWKGIAQAANAAVREAIERGKL